MAVNSSALLARRRQLLDQVRTTTGDHLGRTWDSLDHYTDDTEWNRLAAPIVAAGQHRAFSIQIASLTALLGLELGYSRAELLDKASLDISQPFVALANALSNGATFDAAVISGRDRAQGVGESAVTYAARAANSAADRHVSGWERVPEGGACDWCVEVSGQMYRTADSAAFGHLRCACDVIPAA